MNDKICAGEELAIMIQSGAVDFIVFNSDKELVHVDNPLAKSSCPRGYAISTTEFKFLPTDNLHYLQAEMKLMGLLKKLSIKTLLDADGYLAEALILTKNPNETTVIDCICDKDFFPIKDEFFRHVYKNFSECALRHYDAALISENMPADFDKAFNFLKDTADVVITFARNNSELAKHIQDTKDSFKKVEVYPCAPTGQWIFCYRQTPPQDFAMYVVTHKMLPPEHIKTFPDKYTIINAGAAMRDDLGYLRDDTGDNISNLNAYISELTAFYWAWKHTSHTTIGFCHYRRFFQLKPNGNFLTESEALQLLENYDVLIRPIRVNSSANFRQVTSIPGLAKEIMRKNLMRTHPDYLDAFDHKMNTQHLYFNFSFVARKNVFDAYCEWLFSFILDSLKEIMDKNLLRNKRGPSWLFEPLTTVWLTKNHLRVKEIRFIMKDPFKV